MAWSMGERSLGLGDREKKKRVAPYYLMRVKVTALPYKDEDKFARATAVPPSR